MKTSLLAATALASLAVSFESRASQLSFQPAVGLSVEKAIEYGIEVEMQAIEIEFNGEEVTPEVPDVSNGTQGILSVTDTYTAIEDGRATKLTRRFDTVERNQHSETPEGDTDEDEESELAGLTVVFTWDDDAEEYEAAFGEEDEDADSELLEDLDWDLDFAAFLPEEEVEEGDSWDAEPVLRALMSLGGDLHFDDDEEDSQQEELIGEAMEENLAGDVTCTLTGTREVDGRTLAVIEVSVDAEGDAEGDGSEELGDLDFDAQLTRTARASIELEGELLWDVEGGHVAGFQLAGDVEFSMDELTEADFDGGMEQRLVITFAGEISLALEASRDE